MRRSDDATGCEGPEEQGQLQVPVRFRSDHDLDSEFAPFSVKAVNAEGESEPLSGDQFVQIKVLHADSTRYRIFNYF